jgi:hypothetical protein
MSGNLLGNLGMFNAYSIGFYGAVKTNMKKVTCHSW